MPLPNPSMAFTPFDTLPAASLNDLVENDEALQDWSAFDNDTFPVALMPDGSVTPAKRSGGFKMGEFAMSSTANGLTVTGVGFRPKKVTFWWNTGNSTANASFGMGFAVGSGSNQFAQVGSSSSGSFGRRSEVGAALLIINTSGAETGRIVIASLDEDGFTYNVTNQNGQNVVWLAEG